MLFYDCACGHRLCKGRVSRSTRYRHILAKKLRDNIEADPWDDVGGVVDEAKLPVQDLLGQDNAPDDNVPEVQIP